MVVTYADWEIITIPVELEPVVASAKLVTSVYFTNSPATYSGGRNNCSLLPQPKKETSSYFAATAQVFDKDGAYMHTCNSIRQSRSQLSRSCNINRAKMMT